MTRTPSHLPNNAQIAHARKMLNKRKKPDIKDTKIMTADELEAAQKAQAAAQWENRAPRHLKGIERDGWLTGFQVAQEIHGRGEMGNLKHYPKAPDINQPDWQYQWEAGFRVYCILRLSAAL